jgi:hypothetical protein
MALTKVTYSMIEDGYIDVVNLGADPTGVTDSWQIIQDAIDTAESRPILVPLGIYSLSHPLDLKEANIISYGGFRPTPDWSALTMSDGRLSYALLYIGNFGGSYVGNMATGGYQDFTSADVNGTARTKYCIEAGSASGIASSHNWVVKNVKLQCATEANVMLHGSGYFGYFENVHSSASPVGYSISDPNEVSAWGPTYFVNCYAVVCELGVYVKQSQVQFINLATDNCEQGVVILDNAVVGIQGWNCENVYWPIYQVLRATLRVENAAFLSIGLEATNVPANAYAGISGTPPLLAATYFASCTCSDVSINDSSFYIEDNTTAFNTIIAGSVVPSPPGMTRDNSRFRLKHCYPFYQLDPVIVGTVLIRRGLSYWYATNLASVAPGFMLEDADEDWSDTFVATVSGSTSAGVGTYTAQYGQFRKTSTNTVQVQISVSWSAHTGTGNLLVDMPFTATNGDQVLSVAASNLTYSGQLVCVVYAGTNKGQILSQVSNTTIIGVPIDTAVTQLSISGTYFV